MAELTDIRNAVLAWAFEYGVLADSAQAEEGVRVGNPSILPFDATHADYFRTRKIVRVVAKAGARSTLAIHARQRVAKAKIDELTRLFNEAFQADKIRLEVGISKPFKVDQAVQVYGKFEPIHYAGKRIACGSSVGLGNQRNAGTLTALVRSTGGDGGLFGLSCNHVVGGCSTARPGTPIVVPGIQDVSATHDEIDVVGVHYSAVPMSQGLPSVFDITHNGDLACFQLRDPDRLSSMQGSGEGSYDTPTEFARMRRMLPVKKWGRSTGLTKGRVMNIIKGGESVPYNVTSYYGPMNSQVFKGTVYFNVLYEVDPSGGPFSLGGDSGALVVTNLHDSEDGKAEKVVGVVVAGGRESSLVLPLKPMLKMLAMELVGQHNTSWGSGDHDSV